MFGVSGLDIYIYIYAYICTDIYIDMSKPLMPNIVYMSMPLIASAGNGAMYNTSAGSV